MDIKQFEALNDFLNRMPQEKAGNLGQMETARVFIWFADKAFGMKQCSYEEIEACFKEAHIKVPQRLEYKLRQGTGIVISGANSFAIERIETERLNATYTQYLESPLPTEEELKKQTKIEPPPFLTEDEITDGYRMVPAYLILRLVENSARKWITNELIVMYGNDWRGKFETSSALKADQQIKVKKTFTDAEIKKKDKYNKVIESNNDLFSYLDWGDLTNLVFYIKEIFKNSGFNTDTKQKLKILNQIHGYLTELNDYRDAIAHSRTLSIKNMKSLETRYSDWCSLLKT